MHHEMSSLILHSRFLHRHSSLFAIASLSLLSQLEHSRTPSPSPVIQVYLLITLLFDVVRLRTRWLLVGSTVIAGVQSTGFVAKFGLLILESLPKDPHIVDPGANKFSREDKAGLFSRSLLWWLNPLFFLGYHGELSQNNLYTISKYLGSLNLTEKVAVAWDHTSPKTRRRLAISLLKSILETASRDSISSLGFGWIFTRSAVPRKSCHIIHNQP